VSRLDSFDVTAWPNSWFAIETTQLGWFDQVCVPVPALPAPKIRRAPGGGGGWEDWKWDEYPDDLVRNELEDTSYDHEVRFGDFERKIQKSIDAEDRLKAFRQSVRTVSEIVNKKQKNRLMLAGSLGGLALLIKSWTLSVPTAGLAIYLALTNDPSADPMSPEQHTLFESAARDLQDPALLRQFAEALDESKFEKSAHTLRQRAALLEASSDVKRKYQAIYLKAMDSSNLAAVKEVADAFYELGAVFTAERLWKRARPNK
jgi:hypothetical protein